MRPLRDKYDFLIVGAGYSGLVLAERLATKLGKTSLVIDKREHIGGNSYDCIDENGVLIHPYGPHYFRSNMPHVVDYLSQFTEWHHVRYKVLSYTDNTYFSFPINLRTYRQISGQSQATEMDFIKYLNEVRIPIDNPANSEEKMLSQIGPELYEKFFKGYTIKQWNMHPKELKASVCGRIPIRTNENDDYLAEEFQALPKNGYTAMFQNLLESCTNLVDTELGVDYESISQKVPHGYLIFTGPIDQFFEHCYGSLPYRSLFFEREFFLENELIERKKISGKHGFWQPQMQVNYPNDNNFTRIVELKHVTGQAVPQTTIIREYPAEYNGQNEPFYPIPSQESEAIYAQYLKLAKNLKKTSFVGRLATYRYYNMDQCVASALKTFTRIASNHAPS